MGPLRFLVLLLATSLLSLHFNSGFGRTLTETIPRHRYAAKPEIGEELSQKSRMMMAQVMDYGDPTANTNPKYGDLLTPPPPSSLSPSPS